MVKIKIGDIEKKFTASTRQDKEKKSPNEFDEFLKKRNKPRSRKKSPLPLSQLKNPIPGIRGCPETQTKSRLKYSYG